MALWAKQDGSIGSESATTTWRPDKVLYYFTHQYITDGSYKEHVFAAVYWYSEHFCCSMYGKPLEIWKDEHIPEGPAMFLPIHKVECRFVTVYSKFQYLAVTKTTQFHHDLAVQKSSKRTKMLIEESNSFKYSDGPYHLIITSTK